MSKVMRGMCAIWAGAFLMAIAGCQTAPPPLPGGGQRSNLTPGMVKKTIKKGTTPQIEVAQVFGPPNMVMTDQQGREVWTYDVQSTSHTEAQTDKHGRAGGGAVAGGLAGNVPIAGGAGGGGGASRSTSTGQVSSTTFTLMITFNSNQVVEDYRMMSTQF